MFPFVFIISFLFLVIAFLTSKLQNDSTHLLVSIYSVLGPIETASIILSTIVFFTNQQQEVTIKILFATALGILFLINLMGYIVQTPYLLADRKFLKWANRRSRKQESRLNLILFHFISLLAFFTNYKLKMILFSRLFNFECFQFQLENIGKFKVFNLLSFIGYLPEILTLYCCISGLAYSNLGRQELLIFIDCLIIVVFNMMFSLVIIKKDTNFFEDKIDGIAINKVVNLIEEINSATAIDEMCRREQRKQKETERERENGKRLSLADIPQLDEFAYTSTKRERGKQIQSFKKVNRKISNEEGSEQAGSEQNTGSQMHSEYFQDYQPHESKNQINPVSAKSILANGNILNVDEYYQDQDYQQPQAASQEVVNYPILHQTPLTLHQSANQSKNNVKAEAEQLNQIHSGTKETHTKLSDYLLSFKKAQNLQKRQIQQINFEIIQKSITSQKREEEAQQFKILINDSALIDSQPSNRIITPHHQGLLPVPATLQQEEEAKQMVRRVINSHHSPKKIISQQKQAKHSQKGPFLNGLSINQEHEERVIKNKSLEKAKKQENHPIKPHSINHPLHGQPIGNNISQEDDSENQLPAGSRSIHTNHQIKENDQAQRTIHQANSLTQSHSQDFSIPHPKFYQYLKSHNEQDTSSFKRSHPQSLASFAKQKFKNQIIENSYNSQPRRPFQVNTTSRDEKSHGVASGMILKRKFDRAVKFESDKAQRPATSKSPQAVRRFSQQRRWKGGIQGKKMLSLQKIYLQRLTNF